MNQLSDTAVTVLFCLLPLLSLVLGALIYVYKPEWWEWLAAAPIRESRQGGKGKRGRK